MEITVVDHLSENAREFDGYQEIGYQSEMYGG